MRRHPQGVALITILLVVAIATVLGVAMARQQHDNIRYSANRFELQQARQYALGGEELARQILWQDFSETAGRDNLSEAWADPELYFEFEQGDISLQIEDLQGRINLNNLAGQSESASAARQRLQRLTGIIGIDAAFADRARDWIDADVSAQPLGAEDYAYLGLEQPYRTAGQYMVNVSETRLLIGMDAETYSLLLPFVTALPDDAVPVNLNTAPPSVLQALTTEGSLDIDGFLSQRESVGGFEDLTAALSSLGLPAGTEPAGLSVQSAFFEVRVRARFNNRFAYLTSVIQRDLTTGNMLVIYRDTGTKIIPVVATQDPVDSDV